MKRKIALGLVMLLCLGSMGCGKKEEPTATRKPVATEHVTEMSSANPENEGVKLTDPAEIEAMASVIVSKLTLEEKLGQMFIVNLEQLDHSKGNYYEFRECTQEMSDQLKKYPVGGVILFARNLEGVTQTKELIGDLQTERKIPLFVSVDEEGGTVARIGNNSNMRTTKFPTMAEVGEMNDKAYAYNMGATIGSEIRDLGFNLDFAPVADVKTNEYNTEIGDRSFGSDAKIVASMVENVVEGIQDQGISATLKHFPGHGSAKGDSHDAPVNADTDMVKLRGTEFKPFKAGIEAGADVVMVSHISISKVTESTVPASMSKLVIQTMLRDELGFDGVVVTDALDMGAITKKYEPEKAVLNCVKAGADIVLMSTDLEKSYQELLEAVKSGKISEERINESVQRIIEVKIKRGSILSNTDLLN